jgi:hypothetical protein
MIHACIHTPRYLLFFLLITGLLLITLQETHLYNYLCEVTHTHTHIVTPHHKTYMYLYSKRIEPKICIRQVAFVYLILKGWPETHIKRQATLHGCLLSLLGGGDKGIETVYGNEKNILYWDDWSSQGRTKSLVPARQAQQTNQPARIGETACCVPSPWISKKSRRLYGKS